MKLILEIYRCSECGTIREIPRRASGRRETRHPKHMYCPKCDKETKLVHSD